VTRDGRRPSEDTRTKRSGVKSHSDPCGAKRPGPTCAAEKPGPPVDSDRRRLPNSCQLVVTPHLRDSPNRLRGAITRSAPPPRQRAGASPSAGRGRPPLCSGPPLPRRWAYRVREAWWRRTAECGPAREVGKFAGLLEGGAELAFSVVPGTAGGCGAPGGALGHAHVVVTRADSPGPFNAFRPQGRSRSAAVTQHVEPPRFQFRGRSLRIVGAAGR